MLADGPHLRWREVAVEEARAVTGTNPQIGRGHLCSCSGRVGSEREGGAAGREKVSGQG